MAKLLKFYFPRNRSSIFFLYKNNISKSGLISLKNHFGHQSLESKLRSKEDETEASSLYPNHITTTYLQRIALTIGSSIVCLTDPRRHDMIAVLGETTGYYALKRIHKNMLNDQEGIDILNDRPRINSKTINLNMLSTLPENSLGYSYHKFLTDNNVTPDSRLPVKFVDDSKLAYVLKRYREVHDLFHTILGMPTNMQGEVAVKWVEALQLGLPMCIGGALFGPIRLRPMQRGNYMKSYLPWAFDIGKNSKPMINVYFERRWEQDISDLRAELNIKPFAIK